MKNTKKKITLRFSFYFFGLFILTLGIALTIVSNLGTSPFDALLVGLYHTFGLTVGSWEYIVGVILVILNAAIQRKKPNILAMLTAFITGLGIDFWLYILNHTWQPSILWTKLIFLGLGIIFIGLGTATYLQADFATAPIDGTMLVIHKYLAVTMSTAKNLLMLIFLLFAFIFHGPIALGTLIMVIASGPSIGLFFPLMESFKNKKLGSEQSLLLS